MLFALSAPAEAAAQMTRAMAVTVERNVRLGVRWGDHQRPVGELPCRAAMVDLRTVLRYVAAAHYGQVAVSATTRYEASAAVSNPGVSQHFPEIISQIGPILFVMAILEISHTVRFLNDPGKIGGSARLVRGLDASGHGAGHASRRHA